MKFRCPDTYLERRKRLHMKWRPWFAWYPVRVAPNDCRWLELVERQLRFYEYVRGVESVSYRVTQGKSESQP